MPRPMGRSMGHSAHHLKMGRPLRTGRNKMALMRDANQPKPNRPQPIMMGSIAELFKGVR